MSIAAVVGGQFGSEGKGLIVGHIARRFDGHIRVGAANAGHTIYTTKSRLATSQDFGRDPIHEKHVMQQIPCAAYAHPEARLTIGPGALISPEIFIRELEMLDAWRQERGMSEAEVFVDYRAHIVTQDHVEREASTDLAARIGSTSATAREGIGQAQASRVMREPSCCPVDSWVWSQRRGRIRVIDVPSVLQHSDSILLEGTQGTGLSLTTGDFPYVTSRNTTAAGLCADTGIAPNRLDEVILVCRTYPIRVAGNSGSFYDGMEDITWESIGVDPETERTTVTKKVRRVSTFSIRQVAGAAMLNGATSIALTFCDYVEPNMAGMSSSIVGVVRSLDGFPKVDGLVRRIQQVTGVRVEYLGTGPHSVLELDLD